MSVILSPLAFAAFLVPLWSIHVEMAEQKRRYEETFATHLADSEKRLRQHLSAGKIENARQVTAERDLMQSLNPQETGFPTWPFNRVIFVRFLSPQILSGVVLIIGLSDSASSLLANVLEAVAGR